MKRDLLLRINYEKFTVTLRNDRLVELVRDRIGETTSKVYAEVLRLIEDQISRCQLDPEIDDIDDLTDGPSITTMQLSTEISDEINIATGIGKAPSHKINTSLFKKEITERKLKTEEDIEDEGGGSASSDEEESEQEDHEMNETETVTDATEDFEDHGEDHFKDETTANSHKRAKVTFEDDIAQPTSQEASDNRVLQLRNHLMLLATDSCRFLRRCGLDGRGQWTVDYDQLVDHLRETEVNLILFENFGLEGHRLVRMMRKMGKLDEKMLPNTALMSQKDLRTKLAEMQMAGMVEVQCVPRDAAHTVNRSIYLWFFDADRVASMLLHKVYKTMSRCLQRLEIERRRASGILSLAARSDVQEKIEVFFNGEQLNLLQNFRAKEEMLVGQLARLDDLVGIFRDY
jgi:DNA-directed RNA polymerase III subunit RPC3